jgi:beta-N-acetylhexosaminidase
MGTMRNPSDGTAGRVLALVGAASIAGGLVATPAMAWPEGHVSPPPHALAVVAYSRMTNAERIGQLFMAGVPSSGATRADLSLLRKHSVGNAILDHNTAKGRAAVRHVTTRLAPALRHAGVSSFISTDQEGGEVQRLTGKGFAAMPTALAQGRRRPHTLRAASAIWGRQLAAAGVNLNLAPVADTVPAKHAASNQPIGQFDREYGHSPKRVASHAVAFLRGMHDADIATTVKHFPGLGRATGNTDTSPHVTDPTTRHDRYLLPFRDGVKAGTQFVMVSSATYPHIDPSRPACFSATIITHMLRRDLHFVGVVISDDLGSTAMAHISLQHRAIEFFAAGGTMLLDTTIRQIPTMIKAVAAKQAASPAFAKQLRSAEMAVLLQKAKAALITS